MQLLFYLSYSVEKGSGFENKRSAFAATAVYLLGPEKVKNQLKKKTPSPILSDSESKRKTPGSV